MEEKSTVNKKPKEKAEKKIKFIGCKECGATNTTLIKATDSYYCKSCFELLRKKKFEKKKKGKK